MFLQAHVNYHRDEMTSYGPKAMSYLHRYTAISPRLYGSFPRFLFRRYQLLLQAFFC